MRTPILTALLAAAASLALPSAHAAELVAVSPEGDADGSVVAASGTGDAHGGLLAVSAAGDARAGTLCRSGIPLATVFGYCPGLAVAGAGDATCAHEPAVGFPTEPYCFAVSALGRASAPKPCIEAFGLAWCLPVWTVSGGSLLP